MKLDLVVLGTVALYAWTQGFYFLGLVGFLIGTLVLINGLKRS